MNTEIRQIGQSSRIANFAVDQILSYGEVIITDHTAYQYKAGNSAQCFRNDIEQYHLNGFVKKVENLVQLHTIQYKTVSYELVFVNSIVMIHFKLIPNI